VRAPRPPGAVVRCRELLLRSRERRRPRGAPGARLATRHRAWYVSAGNSWLGSRYGSCRRHSYSMR
jgi:hypothetical protein